MKKLKDFIFCDGILSSQTVFYLVKVGSSRRDVAAHRFVAQVARSPNFYFQDHSIQTMAFVEKCAESIYGTLDNIKPLKCLRRQVVDVTWLASFLRKNPATLLNSLKISVPENRLNPALPNPTHVKNLNENGNHKQK